MSWAVIAEELESAFSPAAQERGWNYFEEGRVTLRAAGSHQAHAIVRGSRDYEVAVSFEPASSEIRLNCECPAAKRGPCKHIYATLLELEERADEPRQELPALWEGMLAELDPIVPRDPWIDVPGATVRLHVVLCEPTSLEEGVPAVHLFFRTRLKNGQWSVPKEFRSARSVPRFDREGARLLARVLGDVPDRDGRLDPFAFHAMPYGEYDLPGRDARATLVDLARHGALHFGEARDGPVLAFDEDGPWAFSMRLDLDEETGLRLSGDFVRGERSVDLEAPRLVLSCGLMVLGETLAEVDFAGASDWALRLRRTGTLELPLDAYPAVVSHLLHHPTPLPVDGPVPRPVPTADPAPLPRAILQLETARRTIDIFGRAFPIDPDLVPAEVLFQYADATVAAESPAPVCLDPNTGAVIPRDPERERGLLARLLELGAEPGDPTAEGTALLPQRMATSIASKLQREGWTIRTDGSEWREPDGFSLRVTSGIDWFDLEGELRFDKQAIALPEILRALREGGGAVPLRDGTRGLIPDELAERLGLFRELSREEDDGLRFSRNQGWILDALLTEQEAECTADSGFETLRRRFAAFEGIAPREECRRFAGELRPYQREALGWLRFLEQMELGGCLADDMGLGKTVMVLAHLLHRREVDAKPALVLAPKSLVWNWIEEARRFAPSLSVLDYSGPASQRDPARIAEHDLVVTTYGVLRRDADRLREIALGYAILDEAQAIKNPASQSWKAARLLQADHRLALTGTPVENHLGDLWAIMEFLNPGMLGPRSTHAAWAKRNGDSAGLRDRVARIVRPVLLRRTKEAVLTELPPRQETLLHCEMGPKQRKCYTELRDHYRATLLSRIDDTGLARSKMHVLEALLRLRQVACHPGLLDGERTSQPSAKFEALLPRLEEVRESGRKALVFSQFTSLLAILRERLDAAGIRYAYLDGKSRSRDRIVESFQEDPELPLFLISLKAGGVGLNLTAADHVFLLDPWWNPAVERQAVDRTHRIGQTEVVNVYRLVTTDTVEERILELQDRKRELAEAVVGADAGLLRRLTRDDLAALLDL